MALRVEVDSYLRKYLPGYDPAKGIELEYKPGVTPAQVIRELGIPTAEASIITVNRSVVRADQELHDGDLVGLFPVALGG
jgi:sulfur carrier protein ThiS